MGRRSDNSIYSENWTNAKLIRELREKANMTKFGSYFRNEPVTFGTQAESGDFIREETRLYRQSWVNPLIDELERRLCK